ncbi:PRC-barrel domain-containing protein [Persicitalea jodogahamensis]|uniref:PRC-barrel domain-containing protein n=1 Tax=Persicitalea jodogahamensis TaxID=402147 RepID=A0A8J3D9K5_9BACT|nr:PRC-barrel domain-containing protein [Persicitalea jodogahamensis]GHB70619.1 hypothetical protein GCM10007390_25430 [Persicitalea jodogahamensis]
MSDKEKDLHYLDDMSDYKVADGYTDPRGWEVKDTDGRIVGKVDGMLASKRAERVVYIDVEVDESIIEKGHEKLGDSASEGVHEFINEDGDTHLIVPIGMVQLDDENKSVMSNQITHDTFAKASRRVKGADFDRNYEVELYRLYVNDNDEGLAVPLTDDDDFYDRQEFIYSA